MADTDGEDGTVPKEPSQENLAERGDGRTVGDTGEGTPRRTRDLSIGRDVFTEMG